MTKTFQKKYLALWCLANLFFAFQFILRLSAGILREDIIQKFSVDAASFGTLAGYYYLGYSGAQIPLGIMLDRLSFKLVTSIAIATAGIGTLTFVTTDNWNLLLLGRFLIGVGSGVAFLSVAKITTTYFEEKYHSLLLGFSFTFGLIGAVFGATPMQLLFDHFGYNNTFNALALIAFLLAGAMLIMGKIDTTPKSNASAPFSSVIKLLLSPKILLIGVAGGLMVGPLEGFADVWAIPFFSQIFAMSKNESRTITSFIYIGMCFGGPLLALIANFLRSTNFMIFLTGTFTIIVFLILFYLPPLSLTNSAILMFFLGICCCYQVLVFTVVSSQVEPSSAGLAIAVTNCINMSFGHLFHSVIGNALQNNWNGAVNESGSAIYTADNFIYALAIIPICCFVGQLGFAFLSLRSKADTSKYSNFTG
ncbi:MAG: MFS transporter [Rickettsiaceae bacterium]|nr:MFS transporter [Rickettsiaceae bacterium]